MNVEFDSTGEYGVIFPAEATDEELIADARTCLPKGTTFVLLRHRSNGLRAWYHGPFSKQPDFNKDRDVSDGEFVA